MKSTASRVTAWLLLLALLLSGAAPAFAAPAPGADLAAAGICSLAAHLAGNRGASDRSQDGPTPAAAHLHHCALCAPAAHAALPPALAPFALPRPASFAFEPAALATPERPVHPGSTRRPRGPPRQA